MTFDDTPKNGDSLGSELYYHDHWNNNGHSIRYECDRPTQTWLNGDFPLICSRCDAEMTAATEWQCTKCEAEFTQGRADAIVQNKPQFRTIPYMRGYRAGERHLNRQRYATTQEIQNV